MLYIYLRTFSLKEVVDWLSLLSHKNLCEAHLGRVRRKVILT